MKPARGVRLCALLLALGPLSLRAQVADPGAFPTSGETLTVSLLTIGQGDLVWERFGHNAILIQDSETGWERAYHWGVFSFQQVDFIPRLIKGTMLYGMGVSDLDTSLREYGYFGRPVWIQELALTPEERWELLNQVEENYLPENRDYRYDYYRDNCSTRVRDALDRVLDGRIRALFAADTTASSFRWHTRRILRDMPPYYLGIQLVLGPNADRPITTWEEMFLPPTLMERIGEVQVPGPDGGGRSLVVREGMLLDPGRPPPPTRPPFAFPLFLAVGVLWGAGLLASVGGGKALTAWRRAAVAVLGGGWSLLAGLGGSLLLGSWLFTDHYFWYANFNLFQMNPLFLPLPVAFMTVLVRGRMPRWGRNLSFILTVGALLGLALELLPGLGQRNGEILALTVPLNLSLWLGAVRLYGGGVPETAEDPAAPPGGGIRFG